MSYTGIIYGVGPAACQAALTALEVDRKGKFMLIGSNLDRIGLQRYGPPVVMDSTMLEEMGRYELELFELLRAHRLPSGNRDLWGLERFGFHVQTSRLLQSRDRLEMQQGLLGRIRTRAQGCLRFQTRTGSTFTARKIILAPGMIRWTINGGTSNADRGRTGALGIREGAFCEHPQREVEVTVPPLVSMVGRGHSPGNTHPVDGDRPRGAIFVPEDRELGLYRVCTERTGCFIPPCSELDRFSDMNTVRPPFDLRYSILDPVQLGDDFRLPTRPGLYWTGRVVGGWDIFSSVITGSAAAESAFGPSQGRTARRDREVMRYMNSLRSEKAKLPLSWREVMDDG